MPLPMSSRLKAVVAYLLLAVGALLVLLFSRKDRFAAFHAHQSLAITLAAVLAPLLWGLYAYLASLLPLVGAVLAAAGFTFVIAVYLALVVAWLTGISNALRSIAQPVPFFGGLVKRWR